MTGTADWLMGPAEGEQDGAAPRGPFGRGAPVYARLAYTGIVPVRINGPKAKMIAKAGVSGRKGVQTLPQHYNGPKAINRYGELNLGWRMPRGVIGIDVDHYEDKHGADDLKVLESELGPLPETWSSTARGDGPSRIYFFKVPEDCGELRGSLSEAIEIIQHHHRYAMVWPSVHAKTGNTYAWYNGHRSDTPPSLDQLAELPPAWLEYLSKPQHEHGAGAGLDVMTFRQTYTEESDPDLVRRIRERFDTTPSCRHDSMVIALGWACREATYGKINAGDIFDQLAVDWDDATAGEGREAEFDNMVRDIVASTPEPAGEIKDDEYEPDEGERPRDEIEFPPGTPRDLQVEALRILRHREAMKIVSQVEAQRNAGPQKSKSDLLDSIFDDDDDSEIPSIAKINGHRRGWGLFYPGHVNGIYGDQSIGKSVIMAEVQARVLKDGGTVVHWEFDNNPDKAVYRRLARAGASRSAINDRFHIVHSVIERDALPRGLAVDLVTLDAMNPAIDDFSGDTNYTGAVDTVIRECMRPYTANGACGLFLDHVGHEHKERQIGTIRKSQAVQGALYEVVMVAELKPGTTGRTRFVLRKDNQGSLGANDRVIAVAVMVSHAEINGQASKVTTEFEEPDPFNDDRPTGPLTPEQNVERIIREMDRAGLPPDLSQRAARNWLRDQGVEIKGRAKDWQDAHAARKERSADAPPPGME